MGKRNRKKSNINEESNISLKNEQKAISELNDLVGVNEQKVISELNDLVAWQGVCHQVELKEGKSV